MNYRFLILMVLIFSLHACSESKQDVNNNKKNAKHENMDHENKNTDDEYVCPKHPQIVGEQDGSCPIGGERLVKKNDSSNDTGERKIRYYRHPHKPGIFSKVAKKDEMGMDFVPIYAEQGDDSSNVFISPRIVQAMGVRTAKADKGALWRRIETVGYIDFDETKLSEIHLRTEGWIEKLNVKSEGERVKKGDVLFEIYSPTLVNAQEEYLNAYRSKNKSLLRASKDRLIALGIAQITIDEISKSRKVQQNIKIYAQQNGIVAKLSVREGTFIKPSIEVLVLADLSSVWLLAEVFETQANWVEVGQATEIYLSYLPGKVWQGRVEYVYPSLNQKTRTLKVRIRMENPGERLKPNMFAAVLIFGGATNDVISIPREALITTGDRQRVIVQVKPGEFNSKSVVTGIESGNFVEIISGIDIDDIVVTSGQFLLDSEASLKASLSRMTDPTAADPNDESSKTISGIAIITKLKLDEYKINLSHEPIKALGWPAMAMDFKVRKDISFTELKSGYKVEFTLVEENGEYYINSINKISNSQ